MVKVHGGLGLLRRLRDRFGSYEGIRSVDVKQDGKLLLIIYMSKDSPVVTVVPSGLPCTVEVVGDSAPVEDSQPVVGRLWRWVKS